MKKCTEIRKKLSPFIDRELPPSDQALIEQHLKQCPACNREEKSLRQINGLLDSMPDLNPAPVFASQAVHRAVSWRRCAFVKERLWKPAVAFTVQVLSFIFLQELPDTPGNRYLRNFDDFPPDSLASIYVSLIRGESR